MADGWQRGGADDDDGACGIHCMPNVADASRMVSIDSVSSYADREKLIIQIW